MERLRAPKSSWILKAGVVQLRAAQTCGANYFDEASVRAFQLLQVFLHEHGHHHDAMTNRGRSGDRTWGNSMLPWKWDFRSRGSR
jgi:hypothetical protein